MTDTVPDTNFLLIAVISRNGEVKVYACSNPVQSTVLYKGVLLRGRCNECRAIICTYEYPKTSDKKLLMTDTVPDTNFLLIAVISRNGEVKVYACSNPVQSTVLYKGVLLRGRCNECRAIICTYEYPKTSDTTLLLVGAIVI